MTNLDSERFAKVMAALGEAFNETISDIRVEAYELALQDLSIEDIEYAMVCWLRTGIFFPKPVELRNQIEGDQEGQTQLAWGKLLREVRRVGYTGHPSLPAATMDAVRTLWGSWIALCQSLPADGPELLGWAKRFSGVYTVQANRSMQHLIGGLPISVLPAFRDVEKTEGFMRLVNKPKPPDETA